MERLQRTRLLSVAVLAVVFCTGVLLGFALDVRMAERPEEGEPTEEVRTADRGDEGSGRRTPMYRQLGALTDQQDARIDSIIHAHRDSMRSLQREFSEAYDPRYWAIIENTRASIKEVLTPGQAQKYDSLLAEYDRRRQRKDGESDERRK